MNFDLKQKKILITGGAGFIGSNLCEYFLNLGAKITCLDNFATGSRQNIETFLNFTDFTLMEGDIRDIEICHKACINQDYVLHQAALGSVPRSINDPITSNEVNISGFLNMLIAARDAGVKRFIYAASSSTYGNSIELPKIEDRIGKPLSPYAVTKYVNELYADVFYRIYGMNTIGLRYFNVFGRRQDPFGTYAAVIPLFLRQLMNHENPIINGDGSYSRDFTYIDNVLQMNLLAITTKNQNALNQVYNTAVGERTTLVQLAQLLKKNLTAYDPKIAELEIIYGPYREGDIPHSLANIAKAMNMLGYNPSHKIEEGIKEYVKWYLKNYKPDIS